MKSLHDHVCDVINEDKTNISFKRPLTQEMIDDANEYINIDKSITKLKQESQKITDDVYTTVLKSKNFNPDPNKLDEYDELKEGDIITDTFDIALMSDSDMKVFYTMVQKEFKNKGYDLEMYETPSIPSSIKDKYVSLKNKMFNYAYLLTGNKAFKIGNVSVYNELTAALKIAKSISKGKK